MDKTTKITTYLFLLLTILFWGGSFPATKIVLRGFGPISYVFLRFLGAALIFGPLLIHNLRKKRRRKNAPTRLPLRSHLTLAAMAFFEPGLYFFFESFGMQYTSASSASLIVAAVPALVALSAGFFLREKLSRREWLGVLLSVSGAVLLAAFDDNATYAESSLLGNTLILCAVISAAVYMTIARYLSAQFTALEITSYQVLYGALYFLPLFLFRFSSVEWGRIDSFSVGALLFLVLGATLLAFFFYNTAISRIEASKAAVFLNGIPIVSVIISALFLGENLGYIQLLGGLVVVIGVTLTNLRRKRTGPAIKG